MAGDEARGVSGEQRRTWKEPLPTVFSNGSSQPMRRNPQAEKSWLPDEDSKEVIARLARGLPIETERRQPSPPHPAEDPMLSDLGR